MKKLAIKVSRISKEFEKKPYDVKKFKEWLTNRTKFLFNSEAIQSEKIMALDDVSFEMYKSEVLGIIGANGSGKSTLFKIFAQITPPSDGLVELYGRVVALIEVGSGFYKELSGRENVFISGAILGMKKYEIEDKLEDIFEFAGIERYKIDTPIKKYSSGMKIRLAFAVAAHLNADILLLDEVLAVSDYQFQQKSLQKIKNLASEGKSIVFVSHDLNSVKQVCNRVVLLDKGRVSFVGPVEEGINYYLENQPDNSEELFKHKIKTDKD